MSQNVPTPPKPEGSKPKRRYKKRVRKVTPTEGLLSNSKEETKNIPLYDPYTGEPNPNYEVLTGKPNPLTTPKGFTIDGVADKARKEFLGLPIINKKIEVEPKKNYLDAKTNNRFLVIFPEELDIKPYFIKSIQRPTIVTKNKKLFGVNINYKTEVSPIQIEIINFIEKTNLNVKINEIFQSNKFFDVKIEIVDAKGLVIEEIKLTHCYISEIMFSPLSYNDDNLSTTTIKLNPSAYSIK
jgi:hypothetical protein